MRVMGKDELVVEEVWAAVSSCIMRVDEVYEDVGNFVKALKMVGDGIVGIESFASDGRMRAVGMEVVGGAEGMDVNLGGGDGAEWTMFHESRRMGHEVR